MRFQLFQNTDMPMPCNNTHLVSTEKVKEDFQTNLPKSISGAMVEKERRKHSYDEVVMFPKQMHY